MAKLLMPSAEASTAQVPPEQRLAFWESHNASTLVGLTCSTYDPAGLQAQERNYDLGAVRITEISGNQHVIERPARMLRTHPKDSVFACVLLEGEAFFYQGGRCMTLAAGDVIAYSTDLPYLYGFGGPMRQLIVEADFSQLAATSRAERPRTPLKLDTRLRSARLLAAGLRDTARDFVQRPDGDSAPAVAARARGLLQRLVTPATAQAELPDHGAWRLLQAEMLIAERLGDPTLDAATVAGALGLSPRHLNRLFATHGCTATQWIWAQRLERAREELASPRARRLSVGDIAYRWGYGSQAHFSRVFKARYGLSPGQTRPS